jgi:Putative restriction endonuclease
VIEVADASLFFDRSDMGRIYARADLHPYWIINLVDRQVEVYTDPRPNDPVPVYGTRTDYRSGEAVPRILDGRPVVELAVNDLLG